MAGNGGPAHVTRPVAATVVDLPAWATLARADNPGPMTLDGTNTWVLRPPGGDGVLVVDPGPLDESHLRAVADHGPIAGVLATHGHPDHIEGLARFQEITGAPLLLDAPGVTRLVTPGHTADSVCFLVDFGGDFGQPAVLTGDTILGRGTTVVAYPDGDLGAYLSSLATLRGLGALPVLPGHGPALTDCAAAATFYLRHREARLDQVRAVVAEGARTPQEIVEAVYADVDPVLWPAAELSVRAQLAHLRESDPETVRWDTP
jgi:glyoxylase-like metal-dependent hydrolase (beta-lactamase superfamily II)